MARTKASVGSKVSAGKSSKARCSVAAPPVTAGPSGSGDRSSRSYSGGNSVCPRETPKWQKPITNFFICKDNGSKDSDNDSEDETATKPKPKRNIIQSDDEQTDTPTNTELDETIELEPLTGESSHKIDEYYSKNNEENNNAVKGVKGKGVGKKTKGKENVSDNVERKREREDKDLGEEQVSKRVKVE
ncbi:PCNA-associated factor [Manduca sexta]|uniref:PCNA-associated factor n=1 Tax=Manduca sexta TaxID=7130 RepID=A0A922CX65_MANSE|nr:PCNA-associated factor [Manduca sexta]KAG6461587.1 hypothetical protein O3G_MSEX012727 [Manduca sexta]